MCYLRGSSVEDFCNGRCVQCYRDTCRVPRICMFSGHSRGRNSAEPYNKIVIILRIMFVFFRQKMECLCTHVYTSNTVVFLLRGYDEVSIVQMVQSCPLFFMVCSSTIFIKVCGPRHFALSGSAGRPVYRLWGSIFLHFVFLVLHNQPSLHLWAPNPCRHVITKNTSSAESAHLS